MVARPWTWIRCDIRRLLGLWFFVMATGLGGGEPSDFGVREPVGFLSSFPIPPLTMRYSVRLPMLAACP